jgi:hypothetical protein
LREFAYCVIEVTTEELSTMFIRDRKGCGTSITEQIPAEFETRVMVPSVLKVVVG